MSEAGVTIGLTAEDEFSSVFSQFVEQSSEITSSVGEITSSTEGLSTASESMTGSFEQATTSAEDYSSSAQNVVTTNSEMTASQEESSTAAASTGSTFKETSGQIAGAAGTIGMASMAAVGLNDAYVRLQDSQLRYDTALANEKKAEETLTYDKQKLTDAQDKLNALKDAGITSGTKYTSAENGVASAEKTVTDAQTSLANSHNTLTAAQNKLGLANEQVQTQWLMMGTSVIPMILTQLPTFASMLGLTGGATDALAASQEAQAGSSGIATAATALWDAVLDANPIGLVVIAIVGLIAVIGIVTGGFKNWTPLINIGNDALNVFKVILKDVETGFTDLYNAGHTLFDFLMQIFGTEIKTWETALQDLWTIIQPIVKGIEDVAGGIGKVTGGIGGFFGGIGKDLGMGGGSSSSQGLSGSDNTTLAQGVNAIGTAMTQLSGQMAQSPNNPQLGQQHSDLQNLMTEFQSLEQAMASNNQALVSQTQSQIQNTESQYQTAGGNLSALNLPQLAMGGIVTEPTAALIGESGPEAVIPLANGPAPAHQTTPGQSTFNQTVNFDIANIDATSDYDWQQNIQKQLVKAAGAIQSTI